MTTSDNLAIPLVADNATQKELSIRTAINLLDNATQGDLAVTFVANAATLTADQFHDHFEFIAGTLTATGTLTVPLTKRVFAIDNATSGHDLVVAGATGATVTVPAGARAELRGNGTDIVAYDALASTAGVLSAEGDGAVVVNGDAWTLHTGAVVIGLGTIASGHLIGNGGTAAGAPGDISLDALLDINFGTIDGAFLLSRAAGSWAVTETLTGTLINAGTISGGTLAGTITNAGTISGGTLAGTITNAGTISGGALAGTITNGGTVNGGAYGGTITLLNLASAAAFSGDFVVNGGTILLLPTVADAISAAGSNQATAQTLTAKENIVSTVTAGQGVRLMQSAPVGFKQRVTNTDAADDLLVYADGSDPIDNLGSGVAVIVPAISGHSEYLRNTASTWVTVG